MDIVGVIALGFLALVLLTISLIQVDLHLTQDTVNNESYYEELFIKAHQPRIILKIAVTGNLDVNNLMCDPNSVCPSSNRSDSSAALS